MKALLFVDLQNDFLRGGSSPVPQGEAVLPIANQLQGYYKLVLATQDWHPANHRSFVASHENRTPGEVIFHRKTSQILWPTHCVQNSRGAELSPALMLNRVNKVFKKGADADIDGYSAFFDHDHRTSTGLAEYLREKRVTELHILGLGTDHCIKATALDALTLGLKVSLVEDACRGISLKPDDTTDALKEMKSAGVTFLQSRDLLAVPKRG